MLSDRDYMRSPNNQPRSGGALSSVGGMQMLWILIGINVAAFFLFGEPKALYGTNILFFDGAPLANYLVLSMDGLKNGYFWQLITAAFMHGGITHLLFNMWGLYIFGSLIAPTLGGNKMLWLYLIGGFSGNALWLAFNYNSPSLLLGASGALFGVMLVTAMLRPNERFVLLLFPVPIKTTTLIVVYSIIEVLMLLNNGDSVAHLAHLGGLLGGYIFAKITLRRYIAWDVMDMFRKRVKVGGARYSFKQNMSDKSFFSTKSDSSSDKELDPGEIDYLLDKISTQGINSLTPDEMQKLRSAREQMKKH
ncbi:MAG: rhomboid family intramembrane serine protease [Lentisphaeria bacterium]|nr:rhomboid family intramembrane serine protease [Lentisphaeria bacterium]